MCGVIGLVCARDRDDLGRVAAELLQTLEYRGYDSTGAAIQPAEGDVVLRKGVGAPSRVCEPLGITALGGQVFCGQVRWATFGAVDDANSQPHVVGCCEPLYGAHNGNVTNCDDLQGWLRGEGHLVQSDNDGEMVVHTIEHHFAARLAGHGDAERRDPAVRRACMRSAIVAAGAMLRGSYAAVVVDPATRVAWAIKAGSSLYAGVGSDPVGGAFTIASSDLSSVLKLTHRLLPIARGEVLEFTADDRRVFSLANGEPLEREPVRSRLLSQDIALRPPFRTFMAQEIAAQPGTVRDVTRLFGGGSDRLRTLAATLDAADADALETAIGALRAQSTDDGLRRALDGLEYAPAFQAVAAAAPALPGDAYVSAEKALLHDLEPYSDQRTLGIVDAWIERAEVAEFGAAVDGFTERCARVQADGGRIYVVCCGSSFHAAKTAAVFFNEMARVPLVPVIPGAFRGQYLASLRDGDLVVAVSQSGETKDLVDALMEVIRSGRSVGRLALVNNVNSTIAQELAEIVVPLHCGPEIAVPATKSFVNQLAVFYGIALRLGERRAAELDHADQEMLVARRALFRRLPELIAGTLEDTREAVDAAAELLYLAPSLHILGTRMNAVALEGALKVREVVLNHTQGYEAAEFKHGPNTILGLNTLYGPREVRRLLGRLPRAADPTALFSEPGHADVLDALRSDYPLLYVTGPDARDVALTVSQVNTHKIRGSITIMLAEEDPALRQAAEKAPAHNPAYRTVYIVLPPTGDTLACAFTATVALQRLALEMSERKARFLDGLGIPDHGVHPDVPKNVSKSITVD